MKKLLFILASLSLIANPLLASEAEKSKPSISREDAISAIKWGACGAAATLAALILNPPQCIKGATDSIAIVIFALGATVVTALPSCTIPAVIATGCFGVATWKLSKGYLQKKQITS